MTSYIVKTILCALVFFISYKLLLEKQKMHKFNRYYLLASLVLSYLIPLIKFTTTTKPIENTENSIIETLTEAQTNFVPTLATKEPIDYSNIVLLLAYILVSSFLFFRFVINLKTILTKAKKNQTMPYGNAKIVLIHEDLTPHSFLNYMFINKTEYVTVEQEILVHEYAHIQQRHSYDVILIELLQIFSWLNPLLFFYKKSIQLNHEFLADDAVVNHLQNSTVYQYLLIEKASKSKAYQLTSQFNYLITKKRLIMMTKSKSVSGNICRQFAIIPVLAAAIFMFSTKTMAQTVAEEKQVKTDTIKPNRKEVPTTIDGITAEQLQEYENIINRVKNEKGVPIVKNITDQEKQKLQELFLAMSKEQQNHQTIIFLPYPAPFEKATPTQAQLNTWKNAKVYGVWLDGKRISNSLLSNYKPTDFSHVFVSKLSKVAINYGKHYYQVEIMTNAAFEKYYNESKAKQGTYHIGVRWGKKQEKAKQVEAKAE